MGSAGRTSNRDNGFVERERRAYGGRTPWPPGSRPTAKGRGRCAWQWGTGGARVAAGQGGGGGGGVGGGGGGGRRGAVSNGGRARCPHRAARVMRVCNGEGGNGTRAVRMVRGMQSHAPRWGAPTGDGTAARWGHRALPPLCTRNSHRH